MPSFMTSTERIVGGESAPSPIPWQVSLQNNGFPFCGATVLDASTLLSAAHCFYNPNADQLGDSPRLTAKNKTIRAGSLEKYSGGQVNAVSSYKKNLHKKLLIDF